jgi:hypothetical protein
MPLLSRVNKYIYMKKTFLSVVLMISMSTTMSAQEFLGKVSIQEMANIASLVKYYNNLPMTTVISNLPDDRMIPLMKAIDRQCKSAYILNKLYAAQPSSKILKQAAIAGMVPVPGGRLMDYNKTLKRYNELKK